MPSAMVMTALSAAIRQSVAKQGNRKSAMRKLRLEPLEPRRLLSRSSISTLVSSAPSATVGKSITFTDHVVSVAGTPSGSVEFLVDGKATSLAQLHNGTTSFVDSKLAIGKHTVVAEFIPQRGTVWAASSAKLTESVSAPPTPETPAVQNTPSTNLSGGTLAQANSNLSSAEDGTLRIGTSVGSSNTQGGTIALSGSSSQGSSALNIGSGTLTLNTPSSTSEIGCANVSAQGATLQLAGTVSALADNLLPGTGTINIAAQAPPLTSIITSGQVFAPYSGNTIVGDGTNAATLLASEILQNTLTISAGSAVVVPTAGSNVFAVVPPNE